LELAAGVLGVLGVLASLAQLMVGLLEQLLEQGQVLALPMQQSQVWTVQCQDRGVVGCLLSANRTTTATTPARANPPPRKR
jgi:hypothetical protein